MKKHVILSVNQNPAYLFYVPLTVWCWRTFGWEPIIFSVGYDNHIDNLINETFAELHKEMTAEMKNLYQIKRFDVSKYSFPSETVAQVSRLYGACVADGYLMTSDIDLIPLSDYWQPDFEKLTVWGRDLTDYHYPIGYIGAPAGTWKEIMLLPHSDYNELIQFDIERSFDKSATKQKKWVFDQDLITARINESSHFPERVDRGTDKKTGYPKGRVDRSSWHLNHVELIDAHLFHDAHINDESFRKIMVLLKTVWPNEDWTWFVNYRNEFKKLCK